MSFLGATKRKYEVNIDINSINNDLQEFKEKIGNDMKELSNELKTEVFTNTQEMKKIKSSMDDINTTMNRIITNTHTNPYEANEEFLFSKDCSGYIGNESFVTKAYVFTKYIEFHITDYIPIKFTPEAKNFLHIDIVNVDRVFDYCKDKQDFWYTTMPRDGVTIINKSCVYVKFTKETVLDPNEVLPYYYHYLTCNVVANTFYDNVSGYSSRFHILDFSNQFFIKAECIIPQRIRVYYNEVSMSDEWKKNAKMVFLGIDGINGNDLWYKENIEEFDKLESVVANKSHLCNIYHCDKCIYSGNFDYDEAAVIAFNLSKDIPLVSKTNEIFRFEFNGENKDLYKWMLINSRIKLNVQLALTESANKNEILIHNYYLDGNETPYKITYNNDIVENNDGSVSVYIKSDSIVKKILGGKENEIEISLYTPIGVYENQDINHIKNGTEPEKFVLLGGKYEIDKSTHYTYLSIEAGQLFMYSDGLEYLYTSSADEKVVNTDDYIILARYGLNKNKDPGFAKFLQKYFILNQQIIITKYALQTNGQVSVKCYATDEYFAICYKYPIGYYDMRNGNECSEGDKNSSPYGVYITSKNDFRIKLSRSKFL